MYKSFYLNRIVYYIAGLAAIIYAVSYFFPFLFSIGHVILILLLIAVLVDILLLYGKNRGIGAERTIAERFSNGDQNRVALTIENHYSFPCTVSIIDKLPIQFQE